MRRHRQLGSHGGPGSSELESIHDYHHHYYRYCCCYCCYCCHCYCNAATADEPRSLAKGCPEAYASSAGSAPSTNPANPCSCPRKPCLTDGTGGMSQHPHTHPGPASPPQTSVALPALHTYAKGCGTFCCPWNNSTIFKRRLRSTLCTKK